MIQPQCGRMSPNERDKFNEERFVRRCTTTDEDRKDDCAIAFPESKQGHKRVISEYQKDIMPFGNIQTYLERKHRIRRQNQAFVKERWVMSYIH